MTGAAIWVATNAERSPTVMVLSHVTIDSSQNGLPMES